MVGFYIPFAIPWKLLVGWRQLGRRQQLRAIHHAVITQQAVSFAATGRAEPTDSLLGVNR